LIQAASVRAPLAVDTGLRQLTPCNLVQPAATEFAFWKNEPTAFGMSRRSRHDASLGVQRSMQPHATQCNAMQPHATPATHLAKRTHRPKNADNLQVRRELHDAPAKAAAD
jgi:hypothetical protein